MLPHFFDTIISKIFAVGTALFLFLGVGGGEPVAVLQEKYQSTTTKEQIVSSVEKTPQTQNTGSSSKKEMVTPPSSKKEPVKEAAVTSIPLTDPQTPVTVAPESLIPTTLLNEKAREATVNIFCLTKTGGLLDPISGSGVIISPQGVILTNAHVAQYFLLKDYLVKDFIECFIRTGSPAKVSYRAELLFIPEIWVQKNAPQINLSAVTGSGEYDFALLRVTGSAGGTTLPQNFPFIPPAHESTSIGKGDYVFVSSYPAGFLSNISLGMNLWLSTSISRVAQIFRFDDTLPYTTDLISVEGTIGAQEGSSGGAIVSFKNGTLLGLIATRTEGKTTEERELHAITMFHVNEVLKEHAKMSLEDFLNQSLPEVALKFTDITPRLSQMLIDELNK